MECVIIHAFKKALMCFFGVAIAMAVLTPMVGQAAAEGRSRAEACDWEMPPIRPMFYVEADRIIEELGIDFQDEYGRTLLYRACAWAGCASGQALSLVSYLLEKNADVNISDHHGNSPLYAAVMRGDVLMLKKLILAGADMCQKYGNRQQSIWNIADGCFPAAEMKRAMGEAQREYNNAQLLARERARQGSSCDERRELVYAAAAMHRLAERNLLEEGAGYRLPDPTVLELAVEQYGRGFVGRISDIAARHGYACRDTKGCTILHYVHILPADACEGFTQALVNEYVCDINAVDNEGNAPLHHAIIAKNVGAVRALVNAGARLDMEYTNPWANIKRSILDIANNLDPSDDGARATQELIREAWNRHVIRESVLPQQRAQQQAQQDLPPSYDDSEKIRVREEAEEREREARKAEQDAKEHLRRVRECSGGTSARSAVSEKIACPSCTFHNQPGVKQCEMCASRLA